jgi:hypothetical protein
MFLQYQFFAKRKSMYDLSRIILGVSKNKVIHVIGSNPTIVNLTIRQYSDWEQKCSNDAAQKLGVTMSPQIGNEECLKFLRCY